MSRRLQLVLGLLILLAGVALGVIIQDVWRPCIGAPVPLDPIGAPDCARVTSGANTAWVGLLWPVGLAAAVFAGYRAIARSWSAGSIAIVIVLVLAAIAANPLVEYFILNIVPQSWDEPPGTGMLTALLFVLSGVVLAATVQRRSTRA